MIRKFKAAKTIAFDLECTNKEPSECFLWAVTPLVDADSDNTRTGSDIESLVNFLFSHPTGTLAYAHNLKYDLSFITCYLMKHKKGQYEISSEIIDQLSGQVKSATIKYKRRKIEFRDSLSLIPVPLSTGMPLLANMEKGADTPLFADMTEVDLFLEPKHKEYCINDSVGLAKMLNKFLGMNKFKLTIASIAKAELKDSINEENPKRYADLYSPIPLSMDTDMRLAYRGALTFVNPIHRSSADEYKYLSNVRVADANSMYPAQMIKTLPAGEPEVVEDGKVKPNALYNLGIQRFTVEWMAVKENKFAFMTEGNCVVGNAVYITNMCAEETPEVERRTFRLTLEEMEYFKKNYDYGGLEYKGGYLFKSTPHAFKRFVDKFWAMKISPDKAEKTIGKLIINSSYGKFAERPQRFSCEFIMTDKGLRVQLKEEQPDDESRGYLPVGIFVTSYARCDMLMNIERIGFENIAYGDTDSLHIVDPNNNLLELLDLHPQDIGKWDHEQTFDKAVYLAPKRYCGEYREEGSDKVKLKNVAAGIKKESLNKVITCVEDFKYGTPVVCPQFYYGTNGIATRPRPVKI